MGILPAKGIHTLTYSEKGSDTHTAYLMKMGFAREMADRVIFMAEGKIVEEGAPEKIFSAPEQARTREFLAKVL